MASTAVAVISVFGQNIQIAQGPSGLSAESNNKELRRIATQAISFASKRYSPSLGGPIAFIANDVAEQMGGEVVSVNKETSEKGVVY